jgi:hypothetical protein
MNKTDKVYIYDYRDGWTDRDMIEFGKHIGGFGIPDKEWKEMLLDWAHNVRRKEKLKLSERVYSCTNCGTVIDRDLNASKNLANLALLGNPKEVKPVEQTQTSDLSGRVVMKQELLFNI